MTDPPPRRPTFRFGEDRRRAHEAMEKWEEAGYSPELIARLQWDRRYSIVRIVGSQFAFSNHKGYVAALRSAWAAGLVPDHGPSSVLGVDLPDVAPSLRGVDLDFAARGAPSVGSEPR
jgi:hypothetical protein